MQFIPMLSVLEKTGERKYAQGAFNVTSRQQVESVLKVHDALRSPAIIQVGNIALGYLGDAVDMNKSSLDERKRGAANIVAIVKKYGELCDIPVALHADHVKDLETIKILIESGFTSVMIDGSSLGFDANVEITREVVKLAHARGVTVEGELGVLSGMEDDVFSESSSYTNPMDVVNFVKKTGVDCLALAYGTMHGVKKGKNIKLRKEIVIASMENMKHERVKAILVSHGSSTVPPYVLDDFNTLGGALGDAGGIPIDQLKEIISCGIGKINIDTDLRLCIARNIREYLSVPKNAQDPLCASVWEKMKGAPADIDFRTFLTPIKKNLINPSAPVDKAALGLLSCMDKGITEIVSTLVVQFGSVGYANRIEKLTLEERAALYKKA
ncbi:MAG: class II fructose-bisphosphate aldolase [Treponemataceae bacterium]